MKFFSKLKQIVHAVPKKAAITFAVVAAALVPAAIFAWGPSRDTFTGANPPDYVTFNSFTDNPALHGNDERNFVQTAPANMTDQSQLTDSMVVQNNQEYMVQMYVHNNAASNLNLVATGVTAEIASGKSTSATSQMLTGYIRADNCGANTSGAKGSPCEFWDEVQYRTTDGSKFKMNFVSGSAYYKTNAGVFQIPDSVATGNGALLGFDKMDGRIPGCDHYSGWLTFKVRAVFDVQPKPAYNLIKTGPTTAKPGETINYNLEVKNTGNVDLTNVKVTDTLPSGLTNGKVVSAPSGATGDLFGSGLIIPSLKVGTSVNIKVSAQVPAAGNLKCGTTTYINKASATTDQDQTEDNNNDNSVTTTVTRECTPNYDLVKSVDKTSAKAGDTLNYTLKFTNTGNTTLTNVVIKDTLPTQLTVTGSIKGSGVNASGITDLDKLFTTGAKVAKVEPTGVVTITFSAKVNGDKLVCGDNQLVNKSSSTTTEQPNEPNTSNNDTTTVVNKDCTPNYNLVKSVDKTSAKPGDTLNYTLKFTNTGNVTLTNVVIKDQLPSGLTLTGEIKAGVTNGSGITDLDKLFTTGVKVAKVEPNGVVTITFSAKVDGDKLVCGENQLINKSTSTSTEKPNEPKTDDNQTTTVVDKECNSSYDLVKTVDKTSAKPGDTLNYTLKLTNTGNTTLTNLVIKDELPNGLSLTGDVKADVTNGSGITDLDKLFTTGVKIAELNKGGVVKITFSTLITEAKLVCCDNTLTNKSSSTATSDDKTVNESDLSNNDATTNVSKDCDVPTDHCDVPGKGDLSPNDPNCQPDEPETPVTPTTPSNPNTPSQNTVYTPEVIANTGPGEALAAVIAAGALTFGLTAWLRSRRALKMMK